jgi:hypothetical protein
MPTTVVTTHRGTASSPPHEEPQPAHTGVSCESDRATSARQGERADHGTNQYGNRSAPRRVSADMTRTWLHSGLRHRRLQIIIGFAVILGVLAASFRVTPFQQAPARSATHTVTPSMITINQNLGETFAPAPPSADPALTAQQAWQQYAEHLGSTVTAIPPDAAAHLGLYTEPAGPADAPGAAGLPVSNGTAYLALNQLAYGYSWHSCPISAGVASLPTNPCTEWLFLNANTGRQIVETWQM